jgi:hypothetical protein
MPGDPKHDLSTWKQTVVGSDEFAPVARRSRAPLWIALGVLIVAIAVVVALRS